MICHYLTLTGWILLISNSANFIDKTPPYGYEAPDAHVLDKRVVKTRPCPPVVRRQNTRRVETTTLNKRVNPVNALCFGPSVLRLQTCALWGSSATLAHQKDYVYSTLDDNVIAHDKGRGKTDRGEIRGDRPREKLFITARQSLSPLIILYLRKHYYYVLGW